jgi:mono/diheme cytochrome c family protein
MNKPLLLIAVSTYLTFASTQWLIAEGTHAHKHEKEAMKVEDHGKKHNHASAHWASPKEAAARINPVKNDKSSIERGGGNYALLCVSCHGVNALGDGPKAASLDPKPTNLKAMSGGHADGDFAWKIANGRGAMPAWKSILEENQIWDLVNFIQDLKNNNASDEHSKSESDGHSHKGSHAH